MRSGRLHRAAELAEQARLRDNFAGRLLSRTLTKKLVDNAFWNWEQCNHLAAWADFGMADRVVPTDLCDWVSGEKSRLVEYTIQACDQMLGSGQAALASELVDELTAQKIRDWRADRIQAAANLICASHELARQGHWTGAIQKLDLAKQQRSDLHYLPARRQTLNELGRQHSRLTQMLRQAICGKRLEAARYLAEQLLAISPGDQVALAANRNLARDSGAEMGTAKILADSSKESRISPATNQCECLAEVSHATTTQNFVMWIDGVGGFLVCTGPSLWAGCYVDQPRVDIPIQGDLRRKHLRFDLHHDQFVLAPIGPVALDGKPIERPTVLQSGQQIELSGQIRWSYRQPHPLSSSARLDYVSAHRTVPWSDAILLMADTLIIGPHRHNHVHCPGWKNDLIVFRRQGQLFVRSESNLIVDGRRVGRVSPIQPESSIAGEDFSIKLEPVFQPI
jgi:hypothetical protein